MPHERLRPEYHFDQDRIDALREIAPEAFTDGKINWATLKEALGTQIEDEESDTEHFGLFWPGKREARRLASIPSTGTLVPVKVEGINEDTTSNIFIEGENLEVLKILRKSYAGRIKMIYIDPPYNTGNDFIYDDDFTEPLQDYLKRTGQIDGEGRPMTTNKKTDGRFHSKWLSMMYPRLRLARELLRDDGVIFVSIDDNEIHHLRMLMDEVFGEECFLSEIIVQANKRGQTYKQISKTHEYLLVYLKNEETEINELPKDKDANDLNLEDDVGRFNIRELRNRNPKFGRHNRPNLFYSIYVDPEHQDDNGFMPVSMAADSKYSLEVLPYNSTGGESCWRWGKTKLGIHAKEETRLSDVVAKRKTNGSIGVYEKYRKTTFKAKTIWTETGVITEQGTLELGNLGLAEYFPFPKPLELMRKILLLGSEDEDIVLDFFAGSGTIGHAVIELNTLNVENRQFILVQLPEVVPENEQGFHTIADVTKERLKRVIDTMAGDNQDTHKAAAVNFGNYKLQASHYKQWQIYQGDSVEELESLFDEHTTPLIDDWTKIEDGLFTEILLLEGFPLDSTVVSLPEYSKNLIRKVECTFHENRLLVCLDDNVEQDTIDRLDLVDGDTFICLDSAIDDQTKTILADKGLIKTI